MKVAESRPQPPPPFDGVASDYDRTFSHTRLGRALRRLVWQHLVSVAAPGHRVLDIGCGTGEDALWFAERGVNVTATDVSDAMLRETRRKAAGSPWGSRISVQRVDWATPDVQGPATQFHGAFSDFGALNCVADLEPVAGVLRACVRPGGRVVIVVMGRWCVWEIARKLCHGNIGGAFRRIQRPGVKARVGTMDCTVWYHPVGRVRAAFAGFQCIRAVALGVFLPPTELGWIAERLPRFFNVLSRLEEVTHGSALVAWAGDHIILEFERR